MKKKVVEGGLGVPHIYSCSVGIFTGVLDRCS